MGLEEVDQRITVQIGENMAYLNEEFEGKVKFELGALVMDPNKAYIPDLHLDHVLKQRRRIDRLIDPVEIPGSINVYLFETYAQEGETMAMMGFTPVLSNRQQNYERTSPQFDRLFIAYSGLIDKTTLIHEMGHFLGLSHPWEMQAGEQAKMGFTSERAERNHMTYHPEVDHFSPQQLDHMREFALNFRQYLMNYIEVKYIVHNSYSSTSSL